MDDISPLTSLRSLSGHISGAPPQDATITGLAIELPGALDDDAKQKILAATNAIALRASASDPFIDNTRVSQLSDGGEMAITRLGLKLTAIMDRR